MEVSPLILTAILDPQTFSILDPLRQKHFPPERNFLSAHLTLFHHLPGEELARVKQVIAETVETVRPFDLNFNSLRHLGRGVAFSVESSDLLYLRKRLAAKFDPWLKPQDRQKFQPHVTIQNKVEPAEAKALFASLEVSFEPFGGRVDGLALWHYLGGPWELEATFEFPT